MNVIVRYFLFLVFYSLGGVVFSQGVPPVLSNFRIDGGQTSRVYFDSSEPITGSNASGFRISGKSISGVRISTGKTSGHYFTVSSPFTYWDNNTM